MKQIPANFSRPDTKERLLDAAERLFASDGFQGTSLRQLTAEAKANLAAVNYHFGSKEALLAAVFERRLLPLNELRSRNLQQLRLGAERPTSRQVLQAFVEPTLAFRDRDPGAEAFVRLVGRAIADPDDTLRKIFMRLMEPIFLLLYETLAEALPQLSRSDLFWRLHFALGALSHTMCLAGRFQIVPPGVTPAADAASLTSQVLDFLTAGMEASCS
ncbi:MAG: CerR family C-terminal domain-containing protein [Desulfuromonadales bacterium]|nr:CerR family C-terminal domain-containing protein [Desulfuromonadales bacterium]